MTRDGATDAFSIRAAGEHDGDRVAVATASATLTYADLAGRSRVAEVWLRSRGVHPGQPTPVAVEASLHPDVIAMILALVELRVPCALIDPRLSLSERDARVRRSTARLSVTESWRDVEAETDATEASGRASEPPVSVAGSDEDILAVIFTSGSTGSAKGARLSRRAFLASIRASQRRIGCASGDRWLLCLPLAHVGGLSVVFRCLHARAAVVLPHGRVGDAAALATTTRRLGVTMVSVVPTQLRRMLDVDDAEAWQSLRVVLVGGAPCPTSLLEAARRRGLPVAATYGLTEACSQVATQDPNAPLGDGAPPLEGVAVRVRDGVVEISGPTLFSGYLPPHDGPSLTNDGWFATQDLATLSEGRLRVHGRRSDMIITGGENVYPAEVEAFLVDEAGVAGACVFARTDEQWGQVVCAALVAQTAPDDERLARAVTGLAPHQRPRFVAWVDALPMNQTGKVDRKVAAEVAMRALRPLQSK